MLCVRSIKSYPVSFAVIFLSIFVACSTYVLSMDDVYEYAIVIDTGQSIVLSTSELGQPTFIETSLISAPALGEVIRSFHKKASRFSGIRVSVPKSNHQYLTVSARGLSNADAKKTLDMLVENLQKEFAPKVQEARLRIEAHRVALQRRNELSVGALGGQKAFSTTATEILEKSLLLETMLSQALEIPLVKNLSLFDGSSVSERPVGPARPLMLFLSLIFACFVSLVAVSVLKENEPS